MSDVPKTPIARMLHGLLVIEDIAEMVLTLEGLMEAQPELRDPLQAELDRLNTKLDEAKAKLDKFVTEMQGQGGNGPA